MAQTTPISDQYIDGIIKSAGPYNPGLDKTQGIQLRELIKALRDNLQAQIADATGADVPAGGAAGQVLAKADGADFNVHWADAAAGSAIPPVSSGEKVVTQQPGGTHVDYDITDLTVPPGPLTAADFSTGIAAVNGVTGQKSYDPNYEYTCIGTNQWRRSALNGALVDLYLADTDDTSGLKSSADLSTAFPAAVTGQRSWGNTGYYERKTNSWIYFGGTIV
ncbi:hypothetical protein KXD93_22505 [Mucilaginibacter sp. BJC16-A38]|uniref:hypothetical protein n=1 Tax=Mucilaginibacter phenanthrenivorans TaxID=1234842 RepID=UPI0021582498|nr:hypothetical protein [Mucilaginibacter phenanthrenivorans]MCR8560443.1 hypothetical protein [Mucilaginibacter phenanthrenivorans]